MGLGIRTPGSLSRLCFIVGPGQITACGWAWFPDLSDGCNNTGTWSLACLKKLAKVMEGQVRNNIQGEVRESP